MKKVSGILMYSVLGAIFFAALGIILGLVSESKMILFDGIYSIISLMLGVLSVYISKFISKPNYKYFPFGKYIFQPLMVLLSSSVLIVLGLMGVINSISDILSGGREINTGVGLVYGGVTFVGCGLVAYTLYRNIDKSELIKSEFVQWFMDTLLSIGIIIGFVVSIVLNNTQFAWISNYIDPIMVILAGIVILFLATKLFINNIREVLTLPPPKPIQNDITQVTKALNKEYNVASESLHISKMGTVLYIDLINYIEDDRLVSSNDQYTYKYREKLSKVYSDDLWLNVIFTRDEQFKKDASK